MVVLVIAGLQKAIVKWLLFGDLQNAVQHRVKEGRRPALGECPLVLQKLVPCVPFLQGW